MPTRDEIRNLWSNLGASLPVEDYSSAANFLVGAQWADASFLDRFQQFVWDEFGQTPLVWPAAIAFDLVGPDRGRQLLFGKSTLGDDQYAIAVLIDSVERYLDISNTAEYDRLLTGDEAGKPRRQSPDLVRREDVWAVRDRLTMFVPGGRYGALVSHLLGRRWAQPTFLDGFQEFVADGASESLPTTPWYRIIASDVVGSESVDALLEGRGGDDENRGAIGAVFEAIEGYFACTDCGGLDGPSARRARSRGGHIG